MTALRIVGEDNSGGPTPADPVPEEWATFDSFWLIYPRHDAKKDARKAFGQLTPAQQMACVSGAAQWAPVWEDRARQRADFLEYFPLPATWIRGERWEDEIPKRVYTSLVHLPAKLPEQEFVKTEIPTHVRAVLDKVRGKR